MTINALSFSYFTNSFLQEKTHKEEIVSTEKTNSFFLSQIEKQERFNTFNCLSSPIDGHKIITKLKLDFFKEEVFRRLSLCPPLTFHIFFKFDNVNKGYLAYKSLKNKIIKIKLIDFPKSIILKFPNKQEYEILKPNFKKFLKKIQKYELTKVEYFRKKELKETIISKSFYVPDLYNNFSFQFLYEKIANNTDGSFIIIPSRNNFELIYKKKCTIVHNQFKISPQGLIEIDDLYFSDFSSFTSHFHLSNLIISPHLIYNIIEKNQNHPDIEDFIIKTTEGKFIFFS